MRICMFVWNTFTSDSRVLKEANTLIDNGHEVMVVGVARPDLPLREKIGELDVVRVFLVTEPFQQALAAIVYFLSRITGPRMLWKQVFSWIAGEKEALSEEGESQNIVHRFRHFCHSRVFVPLSQMLLRIIVIVNECVGRIWNLISMMVLVLVKLFLNIIRTIIRFTYGVMVFILRLIKPLYSTLPENYKRSLRNPFKRLHFWARKNLRMIRTSLKLLLRKVNVRNWIKQRRRDFYKMHTTLRRLNIRKLFNYFSKNATQAYTSTQKRFTKYKRKIHNFLKNTLRSYIPQLRTFALFLPAVGVGTSLNADVYHAHDFNTLHAGLFCAKLIGASLIYDSHELFAERKLPEGRDEDHERNWVMREEKRLIKNATGVITVSGIIADEFAKRYHIPKPYVVMNCAKKISHEQKNKGGWIVELIPKEWSNLILLYVGGITIGRGLEQIIDALTFFPEASFVMVGPDRKGFRHDLFKQAEINFVLERVFYHPPVAYEDVPLVCREATVGLVLNQNVSLNNYFGLPNKLFEYMLGGLPVVASDFPAIREIVETSHAGVLCDPHIPSSIADAIRLVTRSEEDYQSYARNARSAALKHYNWDQQAQVLLEVYSNIAST